uniref:Uncharacterized protein MANES_17G027500 n=1 Tax=Rhizophora mucronata TaxID=61149 RepID=A0A2P2IKU6_RHIMU
MGLRLKEGNGDFPGWVGRLNPKFPSWDRGK